MITEKAITLEDILNDSIVVSQRQFSDFEEEAIDEIKEVLNFIDGKDLEEWMYLKS